MPHKNATSNTHNVIFTKLNVLFFLLYSRIQLKHLLKVNVLRLVVNFITVGANCAHVHHQTYITHSRA